MTSASRARIAVLLTKEWHEFLKSRILVGTGLGTPLVLGLIALGMVLGGSAAAGATSPKDLADFQKLLGERGHLFTNAADAMTVYMGEMSLLLLLLSPTIVPAFLAANTIVREKQSRSLESLLTTPVRTWELVFSKQLFCFLVGVVPTLVAVAMFYVVAALRVSSFALGYLAAPAWLITLLLLGPLLSVLAVSLAIAISARANDVQNAQQAAGVLVLPLMGLMVPQMMGAVTLSVGVALTACGVLLLIDVFAVALSTSLFERETILTRWK